LLAYQTGSAGGRKRGSTCSASTMVRGRPTISWIRCGQR
jgi:hypothetical protein